MSNRKAKAARREQRHTASDTQRSPQASLWSPRLKAIVLRFVFIALFLAIFGFGLNTWQRYRNPPKPLHEFSEQESKIFVAALKAGGAPAHSVWLGCAEGRVETCRLVGQFVKMFRDAGYRVEENRVITWKPAHPLGGVHLILHSTGGKNDPAFADTEAIRNSFTSIGIPLQTAGAPDVSQTSVGIFFGPDL